MICPKRGATRLIIHCTEQAAAALAEGADDWADAWARPGHPHALDGRTHVRSSWAGAADR